MSGMQNQLPQFAQPGVAPNQANNPPMTPPVEAPDPNADIAVNETHGPWMVLVHWYTGPEAPKMAREFVMELRNHYKLPAYVFNRGADERKEQYAQIREHIEQQRKFREAHPEMVHVPGRVKMTRIEDQCAVLVGGYKDDTAAERARDKIKKLPSPDPNRVKLASKFYQFSDPKSGNQGKAEHVYVNPFTKAMVVRNPQVKHERPDDWNQVDVALLRKLNRYEPFSLFECKKPFTLAIKQFHTPTSVQPKSAGGKFLESIGLGGKKNEDTAAENAHNMADLMRKTKLEAYVLHTKFASIVCVGAYDSPQDESLKAMQRHLVESMRLPTTPVPMQVPK